MSVPRLYIDLAGGSDVDDADADWVDASLPSTPLADAASTPLEAGRSTAVGAGHFDEGVRVRHTQDGEDTTGSTQHTAGTPDRMPDTVPDAAALEPASELDAPGQPEQPDERQCRICFLGAEEEAEMGRLISPCLCAGSMRYCHVKCLNAWRGSGTGARAFMECPQCHHQYLLRRTLISGLATSRPLLLLSTSVLFALLTLLAGQLALAVLSSSSAPLARLLAPTIELGDGAGAVIITSSSTTLVYDVFSAGLGAALRLADLFLPDADNAPDERGALGGLALALAVRAVLGIAVLGSLSFVSLLVSLSLFGPLQLANHMRGTVFGGAGLGTARRRGAAGAAGTEGVAQALALVMLVVGIANTLVTVYAAVQAATERALRYVETQILEVNPADARAARDRQKRRDSWRRRWLRERRWRSPRGWYELVVRGWAAGRDAVRAARGATH